jgi:hypothetical protein
MNGFHDLPEGLPVPEDDGAADHLPGAATPPLTLPTSGGDPVDLARPARGTLVYVYPATGVPVPSTGHLEGRWCTSPPAKAEWNLRRADSPGTRQQTPQMV